MIPDIILTLPSLGMGENDPDPRTQQAIVAGFQDRNDRLDGRLRILLGVRHEEVLCG